MNSHRDLERIELPVYSVKAHDLIVNAIDGCGGLGVGGGAPELVTGSRDGEYADNTSLLYLLSGVLATLSCARSVTMSHMP